MRENKIVQLTDVSKMYYLGQMGYRTLREDLLNLFRGRKTEERHFWALKNVSFDLGKGESVGIIGANGAGKSTILKILAGVTRPTSGIVEKRGKVGALIELTAGFHSELTGRENIYLYGSIIGLRKEYINRLFDAIVDFSGLSQFLDTPIKRYSSGMLARLGFSVIAHLDLDILLIDEVLSVGDFVFQSKCIGKMLEYKEKGVSIIFVSHNTDSIRKLCKRVILLGNGKVEFDGDVEEGINKYYILYSRAKVETQKSVPAIELVKKSLKNSLGQAVTVVETGEQLCLELNLNAKSELKETYFALFIRHSNGMIVFDTSSDLLNREKYDFAPGQLISLKYEFSANLLNGNYLVGVNIAGSGADSSPEYLFYDNNLFSFKVIDHISHQGIANLNPKCLVEPRE